MKIALVYDRLNKKGGAEEILQSLAEIWPEAPWFTSVYNSASVPFANDWTIHTSCLNKIPSLRRKHELVPFLMPFIFESFPLNSYDMVISVSSAEAKGVITNAHTLHVNYCLTPTRYLWSHSEAYLSDPQFGPAKRLFYPLAKLLIRKLRAWDLQSARRPDLMISISEHVKKRVKKYYNIDTPVIYPPVNTRLFSRPSSFVPQEKDYYLTVSRLVPYKQIDLLLKTFAATNRKLVIIGEGTDKRRLLKLATPNVIFKGLVPEPELVGYYQNCRAYLQANEEDFGIAMVEAQASGKPVVAYTVGGAAEIVIDGQTGILVKQPHPKAFLHALDKIETMNVLKTACINNAKRFNRQRFQKEFTKKVEELWEISKPKY